MLKQKVFWLVLAGWLMANFSYAQCISGDCMNGTGIFIFPSGAKYIGQFKDGKMEGVGSCYYTDGSKYQGHWVDSYPEGEGVKTLADGSQVRGSFVKGKRVVEQKQDPVVQKQEEPAEAVVQKVDPPKKKKEKVQMGCVAGNCQNGKGKFIYQSGAIYIGEFVDGEIHGIGACYYSDGSKYQGEWVHRYPEGRGTKIFPDGFKWTGRWKKGQPIDDKGLVIENIRPGKELAAEDTDIQSGCVNGDCQNGTGAFAYADGSRYEGQFRNGKPNGRGTFEDVDGQKYVGGFRNGLKHGNGVLLQSDGAKVEGRWEEGSYAGKPAVASAPSGCIQGDCQNGRGTFIYKEDGSKYVGAFKSGKPHGQGVVEYTNGEKYSGNWADGHFEGQGTLSLLDGTKVTGIWKESIYMGVDGKNAQPKNEVVEVKDETEPIRVWAVIVGVASYNHMPTLRYTDDDAYRMYAFLKSPEGGALADDQMRILIDEDATKERIKGAMEEVFGKAGKNDLVLMYFSGHGLKGAFLPIDFDGFNNRLDHDEINTILSESPAKYKLCIADACHSGSLLAMKSGNVKGVLENYYKTLAQAEAGTALIMSSKSEETSLESSGLRQGVFSHFLIRGLKGEADKNSDSIISVQELFDFLNGNVRQYTGNRQSPVIKGDYDKNMTISVVRE
jgi:hypothetical protein